MSSRKSNSKSIHAKNGAASSVSTSTLPDIIPDTITTTSNSNSSSSSSSSSNMNIDEMLLQRCQGIYLSEEHNLCKIAQELNISITYPRNKINVLLVGNHSAGKSSFINWYIGERVQSTGVAIETQGFTFITSGKRRITYTAPATLKLFPDFSVIKNIKGILEFLTTEVSTSIAMRFSMVNFIDSPGLVDGAIFYPFDVGDALIQIGHLADLIFVFFDPMGQALCKRTLNIVEVLNQKHPDRIKFYLSKADEAGSTNERQKVSIQITQELLKRPGMNRIGFELPPIAIPSLIKYSNNSNNSSSNNNFENEIYKLSEEIDKVIAKNVQQTLNSLETDSKKLINKIEDILNNNRKTEAYNKNQKLKRLMISSFGYIILFLLSIHFILQFTPLTTLNSLLTIPVVSLLFDYTASFSHLLSSPESSIDRMLLIVGLLFVSLILLYAPAYLFGSNSILSRKEKQLHIVRHKYLTEMIIPEQDQMYRRYLEFSVNLD